MGQIYQVDPFGAKQPQMTVLGGNGGAFESFAYDVRDRSRPRFFVTEDHKDGALRRFTPDPEFVDWESPWKMLHGNGSFEYLVLNPREDTEDTTETQGTYHWTTSKPAGEFSARRFFRNSEGIDVSGKRLFFVSKRRHDMIVLDLDEATYASFSTTNGMFDGQPDQIKYVIGEKDILYFTEVRALQDRK